MIDETYHETAYGADERTRRTIRTLEHDPGDGPIHLAVTEVVGSLLGADPGDLEPMFDSLDPEALDSLCRAVPETRLHVAFVYHGCSVAIRREGTFLCVSASVAGLDGSAPA